MAAVLNKRRKRPNIAVINIRKKGKVRRVAAPIHVTSSTAVLAHDHSDNTVGEPEVGDELVGDTCTQEHGIESQESEGLTSQHYHKKLQAANGWEKLRVDALHAVVEGFSLPHGTKCSNCKNAAAEIRCIQCGPTFFLCEECTIALHSNGYRFSHTPEIWKDTFYCPYKLPLSNVCSPKHKCDNGVTRQIMCFHLEGPPKMLDIMFCSCVGDALTLIQLHYWPGSPTRPSTAFSFQLLDWIEALFLECQVSMQDFAAAFEFLMKSNVLDQKLPQHVYPGIIDSFEEYRFMKNSIRSGSFHGAERKSVSCPACPKEDGKLFFSMDALFGLCRKKAAGASVCPPLNEGLLFEDVREFVDSYSMNACETAAEEKECNSFLAGNSLRSRTRFKALDETGIMGVACRHEVPHLFINLHHGERISYAVYLMKRLMEKYPNHDINLLYDIACCLKRHLQSTGQDDLLSFYSLAIPIFHCYGHKASCQVEFSPRYSDGYGLSDGEVMERLWSHMRRYSRMTKEMRPSHRVDVLTDGLLHCARKAATNLVKLLPKRLNHAKEVVAECESKLDCLTKKSPVPFDSETIQQWISQERQNLTGESVNLSTSPLGWEEDYLNLLKAFITLRECLEKSPNTETCSVLAKRLTELETKLIQMEKDHELPSRWTSDSPGYKLAEQNVRKRKQNVVKQKVEVCARERWFLLAVKAKYADGHALASRLSRRITTVSLQLKGLIKQYNALCTTDDKLTWEKATDLTATTVYHSHAAIPASIKKEACQAALLLERAKEEVVMVKQEMTNTVMHYINEHRELSSTIGLLSPSADSLYTKGILSVLHTNLYQIERHLQKLSKVFDIHDELKEQVASHASYQFLDYDPEEVEDISSVRKADKIDESSEEELEEDSDDDEIFSQMANYQLSSTDSTTLTPAPALHLRIPADATTNNHIIQNHDGHEDDLLQAEDDIQEQLDVRSSSWRSIDKLLDTEQDFLEHEQQEQIDDDDDDDRDYADNSYLPIEHEQLDSTSSDDEEMEEMDWRKSRFEREQFLQQHQQSRPFSLISEEDKLVLDKIVSPAQAQHSRPGKSFSYSKLPQKHLSLILEAADRDAQRMREVDKVQKMLKKGPHFLPTTRSS